MSISDDGTVIASAILETVDLPILARDADLRVEVVNDAIPSPFRGRPRAMDASSTISAMSSGTSPSSDGY